MRPSVSEIVTATALLAATAAIIWVIRIVFRKNENTRERFAFAALTTISTMFVSILSALADKQTLFGEVLGALHDVRGEHMKPDPPHLGDHALMIVLFIIVVHFTLRIYENWDGAVSERHNDKLRYHESAPLLAEGLHEAKRIFKREPAPKIYQRSSHEGLPSALEFTAYSPAWHIEARDLICLSNPNIEIDVNNGWQEQTRCWIGVHRKTLRPVAVKCSETMIDSSEAREFIRYVQQVLGTISPVDYMVATRDSTDKENIAVDSLHIKVIDQSRMLEDLVDFSDYFADLVFRVERQPLADSAQAVADVYVTPKCMRENNTESIDLDAYLTLWSTEPGQRQLALLGEYGQGKSTAALMFAYRKAKSYRFPSRVPILIELRGRSPRNLTPEDLIAAWAYPYRINPKAVMKLLAAGKILLVLEGFDEMALVGDPEARLAHFQTLWKLCYPLAKILITGRPNFFLDNEEMKAALGIFKSTASGPFCEALQLIPFDLDQIENALRGSSEQTKNEIVGLATRDGKFREIVSRGSLLYVVSQLWEREGLGAYAGRITSAFVMDLFIQHSYRRQTSKASGAPLFMILNEMERGFFMCGVAAYMGSKNLPNQITKDQFDKVIKSLYSAIPPSVSTRVQGIPGVRQKPLRERLAFTDDPIEDVSTDVRSTGILVSDQIKSGALRFAHK